MSIYSNTQETRDIVLMLAHRLRRRPNNKTTLIKRLLFAGIHVR